MQLQQSIFKWPIYMEADGRDYKRRYVGNLWSLDDTFVLHRFCFCQLVRAAARSQETKSEELLQPH